MGTDHSPLVKKAVVASSMGHLWIRRLLLCPAIE